MWTTLLPEARTIRATIISHEVSAGYILPARGERSQGRDICRFYQPDEAGESLMLSAMTQLSLSARGYHRVLKLARTIADLAGCEQIQAMHLAEALQYRPRVMMGSGD